MQAIFIGKPQIGLNGATLLTVRNAVDITESVRAARSALGFAVLIVLFASALLSLFLARTIVTPLRQLARAAVRVRQGRERQVEVPRLPARSDEIGQLARAVSDMTGALRGRIDAVDSFAADVAHEIKNPLGGLRGAAQLLGRHLDDPELTGYTAVIINEVDRLAALVDSLLGPGGSINKSDVNLHDVLEHVIRLVDADRVVNVRWQRDYDPSLPTLMLDRDQMIQAVLNIVRNAIAASDGADVELSLRTRALTNDTIGAVPHRVIASIEIADNGPGIDPEIRDSIFYPLVTGRPDGTGLGLPLSQELIQRHGGLIEFTSEPGHTVFQIRLPMESSS